MICLRKPLYKKNLCAIELKAIIISRLKGL